jgi:hypothetical protein
LAFGRRANRGEHDRDGRPDVLAEHERRRRREGITPVAASPIVMPSVALLLWTSSVRTQPTSTHFSTPQ